MTLVDRIKEIVRDVIDDIRTMTVDQIRGATGLTPAELKFTPDGRCLYNGVEIGSGSSAPAGDQTASEITDVTSGAGIWGEPAPKNFPFAYEPWGKYIGLYLPESLVPRFGLYVHQINAVDCSFVSTDKVLPAGTFVRRVHNDDNEPKLYTGSRYTLGDEYELGGAYYVDVPEVSSESVARIRLYRNAELVSEQYLTDGEDFIYERSIDGITFPVVALHVKSVFYGQETSAVEFGGLWKVDDAWQVDVDYNSAGVYLYEPNHIDLQKYALMLGPGSAIQDNGSGSIHIDGNNGVAIGANGVNAFDIDDSEIVPGVPINMGNVAVTSSRSSPDINELVNRNYVDLATNTSQYWTTSDGLAKMVSPKGMNMSGYNITGLPVQTGILDPSIAATIGYVDDAVSGLGGGAVDSVFGRTGAVSAQQSDYDAFFSLLGHTHSGYLTTTGTAYNSNRLGGSYYTNYSRTTHTHSYLPLAGGTVTGPTSFTGEVNISGGGNTIIGTAGGFPFFPLGIVLGTSSSASENIHASNGVVYFGSTNGSVFNSIINMGQNKITSVGSPTNATDAATKGYVDANALAKSDGKYEAYDPIDMNSNYIYLYGTTNMLESNTSGNVGLYGSNDVTLYGGGIGNLCVKSGGVEVHEKLYIGGTSNYVYTDPDGNLTFHVATGKGIKFEEG